MVIKKRLPTKGGPHKKNLFLVLRPGLFKNKQTFIIFLRGNHHKYFSRKSLQQGNAFNVKKYKKDPERQKAKDNWSYDVF